MGRPPRRGQPLNKGQDGGSERVRYSEVSLYISRFICYILYNALQPIGQVNISIIVLLHLTCIKH